MWSFSLIMLWIFIPYYILGVVIYTYLYWKEYVMMVLCPLFWVLILATACIWPIVLVVDYFDRRKMRRYNQEWDHAIYPWDQFEDEPPY